MPQPTGRDLHVDALLSNVSIAYMNEPGAYVADIAFPIVYSNKQSDKIAKYEKTGWFRDQAQKRASLTETAGGGFDMDDPQTFFCHEWGFHQDISEDDIENADSVFDVEDDSTQFCVEKLRLKREINFATEYFQTGVWTTDLEGQTDTPSTNEFLCWDQSSSTPIDDIYDAKVVMRSLCGYVPNLLIVSERVHMTLKNHSTIRSIINYNQLGTNITANIIAQVFELDRYLVGKAIYATSSEGASTSTLAYILDQYGALLIYAAPRPSKRRPSGGYTVRWKRPKMNGNRGDRLESTIRKFDLPLIGGKRIECSIYEDMLLVAADCGIFLNNAIAAGRTITS